uniref:Uncharacterized protein n=1 Tax=Romanomermis culicivorax TaxID=13658 RepID=A0A915IEW0_ROMCU
MDYTMLHRGASPSRRHDLNNTGGIRNDDRTNEIGLDFVGFLSVVNRTRSLMALELVKHLVNHRCGND